MTDLQRARKHSPLLLLCRYMRHCQSDREQLKAKPRPRAIYLDTVMTFLKYHFLKSNLYQHVHANGQTKKIATLYKYFQRDFWLIACAPEIVSRQERYVKANI